MTISLVKVQVALSCLLYIKPEIYFFCFFLGIFKSFFAIFELPNLNLKPNLYSFFVFFQDPPIVNNYKSLSHARDLKYNSFYVHINSTLLDESNGPITDVGVLVTSKHGRFVFSFCQCPRDFSMIIHRLIYS